MSDTTFTDAELAGLAQFETSIGGATPQQREMTLARMESGAVATMPGAPRQECIAEMIRRLRVAMGLVVAIEEVALVVETVAPTVAPTPPTSKTRIAISGKDFSKAVNYAKRVGGKYDPTTKTWLIPSDSNFLNAPGVYGWRIVK